MADRIMLIEDDKTICGELMTLLSANKYEVGVVSDFRKIYEETAAFAPQLVLLDVNLPYEDGFKVCAKLRCRFDFPIIFVTSRNTDMDELNSIMLGGDAFVTKPYNTAILLAKIASLLKRAYGRQESAVIEHNGVALRLENGCVECGGVKAELTKNEQKILYYLMKNAGKICARADITEYLWDNRIYIDDNTLSVNVTRLREKLAGIGANDYIKTKHRQGYLV